MRGFAFVLVVLAVAHGRSDDPPLVLTVIFTLMLVTFAVGLFYEDLRR